MIVLDIAGTWLTLTAAGFAGLSAFGRPEADPSRSHDPAGGMAEESRERRDLDPAPSVADMRSLIVRALL